MGKTIIQTIGPLYGDVVNGTVFGRPNGSIYIPSSNAITLTLPAGYEYVTIVNFDYGDRFKLCDSSGVVTNLEAHVVAESQDTASYIQSYLSEDSDGATVLGVERNFPAGQFNITIANIGTANDVTLTAKTYYYVVRLVSASGVPVATAIHPVEGVPAE